MSGFFRRLIRFTCHIAVFLWVSIHVAIAAPPTFSAVFSPATVGAGNESTLIFTITTDSFDGVRNGQFTNTLPGDLVLASPASATSNCANTSLSAENGGTVLSVSNVEMSAGTSCSVSVRVKTGILPTTYENLSNDFISDAGNSGTASASLIVDTTTMPSYGLSFSPANISQGAISTLTLDISDWVKASGFDSWSGTINLSKGLTVADFPNAVTDCLNATVTASPDDNSIGFTGNVFYPANPCSVSVDVRASALGEMSASVNSFLLGFSVNIGQANALLTTKTAFANFEFDPFVVAPGSTTSLNITLTNRDRISSLSNIAFSDDLNAALTGMVASGLPLNDICGAGSSIAGTSFLSFSGGSLAPEASCSFAVPIVVPGTAIPATYTNSSSSFSFDRDSVPVAPGDTVSNLLLVSAAPVLGMTFADTIAASGGTTTINYTVTNTDTANAASDVEFSHNFGSTFAGVSIPVLPPTGFCGAGSTAFVSIVLDELIFNVAGVNLAAGLDCSFSVDVSLETGTPGGDYSTSTSSVMATIGSTSVSGPGATDTITIAEGPVLTIDLPQIAAAPGEQVRATFTLVKDSDAPSVSGIGFTLNLENALAGLGVSALPLGEICGTGSGVTLVINGGEEIVFAGGTLDVADSCTFDIDLNVPATAESGTYNLVTSNIGSTVLGVQVTGPNAVADLNVTNLNASMAFIDDAVAPGDSATLSFAFENTSSTQDLSNLFFTMNLDAVVSGMVAAGLPVNDVCGAGSAINGTGTLIFSGGNLPASTNCTFDISVNVPNSAAANTYNAVSSNLTFTENAGSKIISPLVDRLTVEVDEAPTVAITSVLSPATSVTPIPVTITFNEDVSGFDATDITASVTNGTLSNFSAISASIYTVEITPIASGAVTLQVPAGSAQDAATIPNGNIISPIFSIDFDPVAFVLPTAAIGPPDQASTSSGPVNYTVTYSDADQIDLDAAEVNLVSTGTATAIISVVNGNASKPTVRLSSITGNGTLAISLDADTARNAFGSAGATGNSSAFTVVNIQNNDDDKDGVDNTVDSCPLTQTGVAVDVDGCSSAQRLELGCPVDAEYKNHGKYVSCVSQEVETQVTLGLITGKEGGRIISEAAKSDIGKPSKGGNATPDATQSDIGNPSKGDDTTPDAAQSDIGNPSKGGQSTPDAAKSDIDEPGGSGSFSLIYLLLFMIAAMIVQRRRLISRHRVIHV